MKKHAYLVDPLRIIKTLSLANVEWTQTAAPNTTYIHVSYYHLHAADIRQEIEIGKANRKFAFVDNATLHVFPTITF